MLSLRRSFFAVFLSLLAGAATAGPSLYAVEESVASVIERYRPWSCDASPAPLFQAEPNQILELEMIADFAHINTDLYSEETGGDWGVLSYRDTEGKRHFLPVFIRDRGNSRRDFCEWVPLRILFTGPALREEMEKHGGRDLLPLRERLKRMYRFLKARMGEKRPTKGVAQKNGLFRKLGDDIKLVTHCGKSRWRHVGGETREEQERRLLQEYYLYQTLDRLGSVTLKTRLAEITYRDPDGNPLLVRKAFFREPRSRLARRCGLSKRPPPDRDTELDDTSWFQLELYNAFIYFRDYGRDGRNVNWLYDENGRTFAGPYDFDLSGILVPEYRPNRLTVAENLRVYFRPWIDYHDGDERAVVQIHFLVENGARMRAVLEEALLDEATRAEMLEWFDSYMDVLERFMERNRRLLPRLVERLEKGATAR